MKKWIALEEKQYCGYGWSFSRPRCITLHQPQFGYVIDRATQMSHNYHPVRLIVYMTYKSADTILL